VWLGVNTPRGDCVGLLAMLVGLYIIYLMVSRGRARTACTLDHLPMLFRPARGLSNSAGIRPQVREFFISPRAGRSEIAACAAVRFER